MQQTSATSLRVTQTSNRAILNWQSFGIAANESVNFVQPGASAVILNRVVGNDPSAIFGRLTANGHVFLTNPNGVLFARGASVDVGGLVASTLAITNDNFMAGRYLFENPGASGRVENFGQLVARDGGSIALIGPQVANGGTISARLGTAVLAAGDRVTLDFAGDGLLQVRVDQAALRAQVANSGLVAADGGRIVMTSGAANALLDTVVNNSGIVRAASVVERNGEIVLTGAQVVNDGALQADGGRISVSAAAAPELAGSRVVNAGRVDVSSEAGAGGRIEASGDLIVNTGTLNASGASGGTIDVSGRYVALGGHVAADGRGDGGSVSVLASATLSLADRVTAIGETGRGGAITYRAGGSLVETSTGLTDASGAGGGGRIAVEAGGGILSSGTYRAASSAGDGGRIDFTGHGVRLLSATFDASGETRGGLVRLGGAFQGGKTNPDAQGYDLFVTRWGELPALSAAQRLFVNDSSAVDVSSRAGRGGTAVFWSDRETTQLGRINASGAAGGGAVEISSGDVLRHAGLSGLRGAATLLLDPKNITIGDAEAVSTWSYSAILGRGYTGGKNLDLGTALEAGDNFGISVALNAAGDRLAVGAWGDNGFGNVRTDSGSVRLFSFTDTNFSGGALQATIGRGYTGGKNLDLGTALQTDYRFGSSVALNAAGNRLAVGAFFDDGFDNVASASGAVRLFSFTDTNFSGGALQGTIGRGYTGGKNLDLGAALEAGDLFGISVALNAAGDRLAVGAAKDAGFGNVQDFSGSVRLFSFTDTNFSGGALQATIGRGYTGGKNLDLGTAFEGYGSFGTSVALNAAGDRLAVGAVFDDGFGNVAISSGAVRLFSFTDTSFSGGVLQATIGRGYTGGKNLDLGTALARFDGFGHSVALNAAGDRLAVGAVFDDGFGNVATDSGSVRLFSFTDTNFSGGALQATIGRGYTGGKNLDIGVALEVGAFFGSSVALNAAGDRLAVGVSWNSISGIENDVLGAVHLFAATVESGSVPAQNYTFASVSPDASITVSRSDLERVLGEGTAVTLQANNDITVANAVSVPGASGGSLTLQAGRSILFNANVTTANGNLTARANDPGADPAYRDAGSGDIVIAAGAALNVGTGTLTLAGERFLNNSGASALQATGAGRWLVWSADPANDNRGGLAFNFKQYNATYDDATVAGTGNGFLYSLAPSITPGLTGTVTRTYDQTASATLTAGNYTVTGAVDGDTVTLNNPVSGTYQSPSAGSTITVDVSGIDIASATNGTAAVYGYTLASSSASGAIGTINPLPVTLTGTRAYDGTAVAGGSILSASNLISGDALTVSGSGTLASRNAGNQSITGFGTLALSNTNYTLSGASGNVNVTAAPLTIRADNQSRAVGAENPPLTASLIGLRTGDAAGVVTGLALSTTAGTGSPAGAYPITPSGASAPNYSISYTNGVLTVTGSTDGTGSPPGALERLIETQLAAVVAELNTSGSVVDRAQVERRLLDRLGVKSLPIQAELFTLLQRELVRVTDPAIRMPGSSQK